MEDAKQVQYIPEKRQSGLNDPFARTVFDSLSAHIAILDRHGVILATNRAWQRFAGANGMEGDFDSVGYNYISVCEASAGEDAEDGRRAAEGIRQVIDGETEEFLLDYPCHSPAEKHWFYMRAIRFAAAESVRVIVSHEEITGLKLAEESLKENETLLKEQKRELEEANIALKVLLKQREGDRIELEEKVLSNIKELVFPYLERLKNSDLKKSQKATLEIVENHLKEIVSPFLKRLSALSTILTPQELQVATLIKDGKTGKEIGDMLNVSISTVNFHRKNLRMKFGLNNKRINLRSYLMSTT